MDIQIKESNILILGGSGFIGAAVSRHLKQKRVKLQRPSSKDCNLYDKKQSAECLSTLKEPCQVIFCAGIVSQREPTDHILSQNIEMVKNFCEVVDQEKVQSIIFLSTCDVYGYPKVPITEQTLSAPKNYYGIGKLVGEYIMGSVINPSIPVTILRLPGIYGAGDDKSTINVLLNQLIQTGEVHINGDGSALRDYVDINDVCLLMEYFLYHPYAGRVNVATGQSISVKEIVNILADVLNITPQIKYTNQKLEAKNDLVFDISLLKQLVPNFQFIDLRQGIMNYVRSLQHV